MAAVPNSQRSDLDVQRETQFFVKRDIGFYMTDPKREICETVLKPEFMTHVMESPSEFRLRISIA
jgi:hypothetical protein